MTPLRIVLIGGGEHARVIIDAMRANGTIDALAGFVDDAACEELTRRFSVPRLGTDANLSARMDLNGILGFGGVHAAERRRAAVERLTGRVRGWATVVHSNAILAADVKPDAGTVIFAGAVINCGASVGAHCIVNTGAIIEHDVLLGDHTQVSPGAVLGGGVRVGEGAYIGLGARIRDHVTIGRGAVVGMGAVVVRDVAPGATALGVPAR
jgi:acetyltransferase EpsM